MNDNNHLNMQENSNVVQQLLQSGEFDKARDQLVNIVASNGNDITALSLLAAVNGQLGLFDDVILCCQDILSIQPDNTDALHNTAQALVCKGRLEEAIPVYEKMSELLPENEVVLNNLGSAYMVSNRFPEARGCFERSITLQPEYIEPRINLGRIYTQFGRPDKAIETYRDALHYQPDNLQVRYEIASALMTAGETGSAESEFKYILDKQPDHSNATAGLALLYKKQGHFSKSIDVLEPAITHTRSVTPPLAIAFANIAKHFDKVEQAIDLLKDTIANSKKESIQPQAYYQLGKLYEGLKIYDESFKYYQQANESQVKISEPLSAANLVDKNINLWTPEFIEGTPVAKHDSEIPVFIVGLPRSGTSLVEQILATHPDVFGAGELHALPDVTAEIPTILNTNDPYPQCLNKLTQEAVEILSKQYLDKVLKLASGSPLRITDKMPSNFLHVGLIKSLFPRARVINCVRDAVDTCLSIYFNEFPLAAYTTDFNYLGTHYLKYKAMMKHWQDTLGISVMNINYEELIDNPEDNIRMLIEFCGLQWDPACMNFHESERFVNTLSHEQVRRPLYRDSIKRWKNYEPFIQPLIKILNQDLTEQHN